MIALQEALKQHIHLDVMQQSAVETDEMAAQCETCQGMGMVTYNVPLGHPRFGKVFPCPAPDCPIVLQNMRRRQAILLRKSHWAEVYDTLTFETWQAWAQERDAWRGKIGAYCAAYMFAHRVGEPFRLSDAARACGQEWPSLKDDLPRTSLVLTGDVGLGKTGLAISVTNVLRTANRLVLFLRAGELVGEIQKIYGLSRNPAYDGPSADDVKEVARSAPFLILDEFNLKNYTADRMEILEDIMRARDRAGLPFMATTNLSLNDFYANWERQVADVVAKAHWVPMSGEKFRETTYSEVESF